MCKLWGRLGKLTFASNMCRRSRNGRPGWPWPVAWDCDDDGVGNREVEADDGGDVASVAEESWSELVAKEEGWEEPEGTGGGSIAPRD